MHERLGSEQLDLEGKSQKHVLCSRVNSNQSTLRRPDSSLSYLSPKNSQKSDCRAIRWGKTTKEATDVCDLVRYSKQRDTCTRGDFFPVLRRRQLFGQVGLTYKVGSLNITDDMKSWLQALQWP